MLLRIQNKLCLTINRDFEIFTQIESEHKQWKLKKKTCLFNKKLPVIYGAQKKINNNVENGRVRIRRNSNSHLCFFCTEGNFFSEAILLQTQGFSFIIKFSFQVLWIDMNNMPKSEMWRQIAMWSNSRFLHLRSLVV